MSDKKNAGGLPPDPAARRLAEIDRLSQDIRARLEAMAAGLTDVSAPGLKAITSKLDLLHAAHLKVLAAEDAFHAKIKSDPDSDATDYTAIRAEIGRQLDRIRDALLADGFLGQPEQPANCNAALPVRILGDAPPDDTAG